MISSFLFPSYGIWCRIFLKGWILILLLPFLKNKQLNRGFVIGGLKFFSPQRTWVVVQLTDKVSSRVTLQKIFFFGEVHWVVLRKKLGIFQCEMILSSTAFKMGLFVKFQSFCSSKVRFIVKFNWMKFHENRKV